MTDTFSQIAGLLSDDGVLICTKAMGCALVTWPIVTGTGLVLAAMALLLGWFLSRISTTLVVSYAIALAVCLTIIVGKLRALV